MAQGSSANGSSGSAVYDAHVRQAWTKRALSDGTKLKLGRVDQEQMFAVTLTGTIAVVATRSGWRYCADGSQARATIANLSGILPNAGGHTHPLGRAADIMADIPGPEDGQMAAATRKTAYVISKRRAFAIDQTAAGDFSVRVIVGAPFSSAEKLEMNRLSATWKNNKGGSGLRCTFIPDP